MSNIPDNSAITSRTANVLRNVFWGIGGTVLIAVLGFIARTVFVYVLGAEYLGVNGLFTNVLAVLSFSELGIGSAITYALYKPIAEGDDGKIKALMRLFKIAYRVIATVIACLGLALLPFLDYLVNADIPMGEVRVYYLVFLLNTVISYLIVYKTSFITALQKNYIVTNAQTLSQTIGYILQIAVIFLTNSFFFYLLTTTFTTVAKNVAISIYVNKRFPILTQHSDKKVAEPTKRKLLEDVRALIIHKIGDTCVHQTDNIIVSAFLNTLSVGLISNYTMISSMLSQLTNIVFGSFTASFGNFLAKNNEGRSDLFDEFDFICFWLNGFIFIGCVALAQPFVTLWLGSGLLVDDVTVVLLFLSVFLEGQTISVYQFKIADGRFKEDQWLAFVQAVVNLVASIALVNIIGLPGVFLGTIIQRIVVIVWRPRVVYKYILGKSSKDYYLRFVARTLLVVVMGLCMKVVISLLFPNPGFPEFVLSFALALTLPNALLILVYFRKREFRAFAQRLKLIVRKR